MSEAARHAVAADTVFDGTAVHPASAVVIAGSAIVAIVPQQDLPAGMAVRRLPDGLWLAAGFIDLQVNGGGDVLFNDAPTPATVETIVRAHRRFGTTALLPTLISDTPEKMRAARAAVEAAAAADPGVLGIHFEGPHLSPEKSGAHEQRMIRPPQAADLEFLTASHRGIELITLAPETVPAGFVAALARAGLRVSLGHSMATYAQTKAAMAEGLSGFTHLFNAMRPLGSREPGPIAAALEADDASFGMIVDGVHVDPAMLRLALRGRAQPMLVSDAMPPAGGERATFTLAGHPIAARGDACVRPDGTLAGTCLTMAAAVANTVRLLGLPLTSALRIASGTPAAFLGLAGRLGRLAPGYRADMVAFDPADIAVHGSWVAGTPCGMHAADAGPDIDSLARHG